MAEPFEIQPGEKRTWDCIVILERKLLTASRGSRYPI